MSNDAEKAVQYLHDNNIIVSTGLIGAIPMTTRRTCGRTSAWPGG